METGRVALIRYSLPDGTRCVGSGLLLDGGRVLTADHVADGVPGGFRVESGHGVSTVTDVLRSGTTEADLAVLTLAEPVEGLTRLGCARVGRGQIEHVDGCVAVGFPRWRKDGDVRRSAQVTGRVPTGEGLSSAAGAGLAAGWLTLVGDRLPGAPDIPVGALSETAPNPWGGMSGAVVTAGDLVVGVVRSHNVAAGGQSLTVTPVTLIERLPDPALRQRFWEALGVGDPDGLPLLPDATVSQVRVTELRGLGHQLDFTGRAEKLARLHELLTGPDAAPVVLYGLGGVGKSQLAVEYAHAHRAELPVVWMARADDPSVLAADLAALGVAVGAADPADADVEVQLLATRRWLASHPGWLIIVDNVDDPAVLPAVHRLLPDSAPGRVIVTSRISAWSARFHRLEVTVLDAGQAAGLLMRGAADTDQQAAASLADDLGGLPLALQQAAGYCQQNGKTLDGYLALFRDTRRQARLLAAGIDGSDTVAATWLVSVAQVRQTNPAATTLLDVLAYLAPDAVPRALLMAWEDQPSDTEPPPADSDPFASLRHIDDLALDEALGLLHRYSLIQLTPESVTVHRLVQAVIRASHDPQARDECTAAAVSLTWEALPELDHDAWPMYEELLPHALSAGTHGAAAGAGQAAALRLLSLAGFYQRERGLYAGARKTHEQALAITEELSPDDPQLIIDALDALVVTLMQSAEPTAACPLAERALSIAERDFGPNHEEVMIAASNLGDVLRQMGRTGQAVPYLERAVAIAEREFGPDHAQTLTPANNLATSLIQLGRTAEAVPYLERAVAIAEREFGPNHAQTLIPVNNLATSLMQLGRTAEAVPYLERAVAIAEREFGPNHPQTLIPVNNMGETLRQLGRTAEALPSLERAVAIARREFGPDHAQTLIPINNLANGLIQLGRAPEAFPYLERAVAIAEREFGPDHPQALLPINNIGEALVQLGRTTEALPYLERAVAIAEREFGPNHPQALLPINNIGEALVQLGRTTEALPYLERAVAIAEREFGPNHPQALLPISNMGGTLVRLGRAPEALPYLERALAIAEREFGPDHPQALPPLSNMGEALRTLGRAPEALSYLERALAIADGFGSADRRVSGCVHQLVNSAREAGAGTLLVAMSERAAALCEAAHGPASSEAISDLRTLAAAYAEYGRPADAVAPLRRVLAADEAKYGTLSHRLIPVLRDLAGALSAADDRDAAADVLERLVGLHNRFGAETAEVIADLRTLVRALLDAGRPGDAETYLGQAADIEARRDRSAR